MSDPETTIAIPADPDDPEDFDVTEAALERALMARRVRVARHESGLTQEEFAEQFNIPVGTLRDWEQGRSAPPPYAIAYVRLAARHPELTAEVAAE